MLTECKKPSATLRLFKHDNAPADFEQWKALVCPSFLQPSPLGVIAFATIPSKPPKVLGSFQTVAAKDGSLTATQHL